MNEYVYIPNKELTEANVTDSGFDVEFQAATLQPQLDVTMTAEPVYDIDLEAKPVYEIELKAEPVLS